MSQRALDRPRKSATTTSPAECDRGLSPADERGDIASLLEQMTLEERVRAYRSKSITHRELTIAAAREPNRMPILNGEFEWIALSLADLD